MGKRVPADKAGKPQMTTTLDRANTAQYLFYDRFQGHDLPPVTPRTKEEGEACEIRDKTERRKTVTVNSLFPDELCRLVHGMASIHPGDDTAPTPTCKVCTYVMPHQGKGGFAGGGGF